VQPGTEVMNKINLQDVQLNYQLTDRIGFGLTLPILFASQRSNNSYCTLHFAGIGDAAVLGQVWLWNPKHARRGNINLGLGFQAPSGNDHVTKQCAHVAKRHGSDEHRGVLRHSAWQRRLGHDLPMAGLQSCWSLY
jgi:hypothetical protein